MKLQLEFGSGALPTEGLREWQQALADVDGEWVVLSWFIDEGGQGSWRDSQAYRVDESRHWTLLEDPPR